MDLGFVRLLQLSLRALVHIFFIDFDFVLLQGIGLNYGFFSLIEQSLKGLN
jgi:hypothetical protein